MKPNPKTRRNPLTKNAPPTFVSRFPGGEQVWSYKGRDIRVYPIHTQHRGDPKFRADWVYFEEGKQYTDLALGMDAQDALANARHHIDIEDLGMDWYYAEAAVQNALDDYRDNYDDLITHQGVARHLEKVSQGARHGDTEVVGVAQVKAFNKLDLQDRLRLIDEVIEYQKRMNMVPKHRLPNPSKMTRRRKPRGLELHTKGPQPGRQRTPHAYAHLEEPIDYSPRKRPADWWSSEAKDVFKEELAKGTDPDDAWNLALKKHIEVLSEANPNLKAKLLR